MAAQDQVITKNFQKYNCKKEIDSTKAINSRYVKSMKNAFENLTSGCPTLAKKKNLSTQNRVGAYLRNSECKIIERETGEKWYTHTKPVCYYEDVTVMERMGTRR